MSICNNLKTTILRDNIIHVEIKHRKLILFTFYCIVYLYNVFSITSRQLFIFYNVLILCHHLRSLAKYRFNILINHFFQVTPYNMPSTTTCTKSFKVLTQILTSLPTATCSPMAAAAGAEVAPANSTEAVKPTSGPPPMSAPRSTGPRISGSQLVKGPRY